MCLIHDLYPVHSYTVSNYIILSWRQLVRRAVVAALIRRAVVAALRPRQPLHTGLV